MKNLIQALFIFCSMLLSSCGGGTGTQSEAAVQSHPLLSVVHPSQLPAHQASIAYVTVTNQSDFTATNLTYSITNNTSDGTIALNPDSLSLCSSIAKNDSCTLQVAISADANPGSFTVLVTAEASPQGLIAAMKQKLGLGATKSQMIHIGLLELPSNSTSGADGITILHHSIVNANPNGTTQVILTAMVTSDSPGIFNTINLTNADGDLLDFRVLSGNSGSGASNLAQGALVSFIVTIPTGASQLPIYVQTAEDGNLVDQGTVQHLIQITDTGSGILAILPTNVNLNIDHESQVITLANHGDAALNNLNIVLAGSVVKKSATSCTGSLAAHASCTYTVNFDASVAKGSSSTNITASYNNGLSDSVEVAQIVYRGASPSDGLTISSGSNPNFNFVTTTATPNQASLITINNTGNSSESSITFLLPEHFTLSAASTNSCSLEGDSAITDNLPPAASCNLTLSYSNTSVTSGSAQLVANYVYNGSSAGTPVNVALTYATTQSAAILSISPTNYTYPNLLANNQDTLTTSFKITNLGDNPATNLSTNIIGTNAELFTVIKTGENDCSNFAALKASDSCIITIQDGPTASVIALANASLQISYLATESQRTQQAMVVASANLTATTTALPEASIAVQAITLSPSAESGNGSNPSQQWQIAQNTTKQSISISYVNTGHADAVNFVVDTNNLSSGYTLSNNSCNGITLSANSGNACTVILNLNTAVIGAADLLLTNVTSTWNTHDTPQATTWLNPETLSSQTSVFVNIFATPTIQITTSQGSPETVGDILTDSSYTMTATLAGGYSIPEQIITLAQALPSSDYINYSNNACAVSSTNPSCSIKINIHPGALAQAYTTAITNSGSLGSVALTHSRLAYNVRKADPLIYISSKSYNGNLQAYVPGAANGISAADSLCQADTQCPTGSTCRAMLVDGINRDATNNSGAGTNWVLQASTTYKNISGAIIGRTGSGTDENPAIFTFPLTNAFSTTSKVKFAWTGLNPNWTTNVGHTCNSWMDTGSFILGNVGETLGKIDSYSINHGVSGCSFNTAVGLYCVEQP